MAANLSLLAAVSAKAIVHPRKRYIKLTEIAFFIFLCQAGLGLAVALQKELNCKSDSLNFLTALACIPPSGTHFVRSTDANGCSGKNNL